MKAMTQIFRPTTPLLTARVMDILFDGVAIDCSSDEFEAASFCSAMGNEKGIKTVNDTHLSFSVLGTVSCIINKADRHWFNYLFMPDSGTQLVSAASKCIGEWRMSCSWAKSARLTTRRTWMCGTATATKSSEPTVRCRQLVSIINSPAYPFNWF